MIKSSTLAAPESELGRNWKCPYCNAHQVLLEGRYDTGQVKLKADNSIHDKTALLYDVRVCANANCRKMSLIVRLCERQDVNDGLGTIIPGKAIQEWPLMPSPITGKLLPDKTGIPPDVRDDYATAQRLKTVSPRASAAYGRSALSGMLEDFCKIAPGRLSDQVAALQGQVRKTAAQHLCYGLAEIVKVQNSGNIKDHMKAPPDTMVTADEGEPGKLLDLIDLLAEEWYAVRHRRHGRDAAGDCCRMEPRRHWLCFW